MKYPALAGPRLGNSTLNLVFAEEEVAFPVEFYAAMVQDQLKETIPNVSQISEDFLTTPDGKDYFRWEIEYTQFNIKIHQIIYFFESGDWKLIITYSRPSSQGSEYDAQVDDAIETLQFKH